MGIVTDYFIKLIQRQVDEKGIVVWFDPSGTYASLANYLTLPDTRVHRLNGSFLALRREADDLMNDADAETPPRLVLYVPAERSTVGDILGEFVAAGVEMRPHAPSILTNTDLEVVVRRALSAAANSEKVESICDQVRRGQIASLSELDQIAEGMAQAGTGALALTFGAGQPFDVALAFLTSAARDKDLTVKRVTPELAALLNEAFEANLPPDEEPDELRARFRRHVLITEFCAALHGDPPPSLASVRVPDDAARGTCIQLARTWRNRRDLQASYVEAARRIEADFGLSSIDLEWRTLRDVETFAAVDERIQVRLEEALCQQVTDELIQVANDRQAKFWAEVDSTIRARWALIATAGRLLRQAARIQDALKAAPPTDAVGYIERYTRDLDPWCQLDTHHRVLERMAQVFDLDPHGRHGSLEKVLARARQQYSATVDQMSRQFVAALADARFTLGGMLYQTEVFSRHVGPDLASVKTAYVLVDALRFEMARDLAGSLGGEWEVDLLPAIGTPPTITPVGMVALLPGAERGVALVDAGGGKVTLEIGGQSFKERKDRVKYLAQQIEGFYDVKLEALVPAKQSVREAIKSARFVLVTSQEIDLLGEGDIQAHAREFMDSALLKLARAFRLLVELGVERIVVAADHGYIFADELDTDLTLPAPGGQMADLHRRVWVGKGGQTLENVLRIPAEALNLGGDLELATPYGLAGFAAGGGRAFLHGGLSLQELIIPVVILQPIAAVKTEGGRIEWDDLKPGSAKLSTRFFSVTVSGRTSEVFDMVPPRVRVEVRARNKPISVPVSASYGYQEATGEVELRRKANDPKEIEPNTITVMIRSEPDQKTVSVLLIDAETEQTLKSLDKVEVAIAL